MKVATLHTSRAKNQEHIKSGKLANMLVLPLVVVILVPMLFSFWLTGRESDARLRENQDLVVAVCRQSNQQQRTLVEILLQSGIPEARLQAFTPIPCSLAYLRKIGER